MMLANSNQKKNTRCFAKLNSMTIVSTFSHSMHIITVYVNTGGSSSNHIWSVHKLVGYANIFEINIQTRATALFGMIIYHGELTIGIFMK